MALALTVGWQEYGCPLIWNLVSCQITSSTVKGYKRIRNPMHLYWTCNCRRAVIMCSLLVSSLTKIKFLGTSISRVLYFFWQITTTFRLHGEFSGCDEVKSWKTSYERCDCMSERGKVRVCLWNSAHFNTTTVTLPSSSWIIGCLLLMKCENTVVVE